ncbi:MAG: adenylylsulfate reductase subunit alpha, partial [Desulfovibrio sp.]|nr:adenylylsulfate reductase subunit alpha [Desulfovibrio sp.]
MALLPIKEKSKGIDLAEPTIKEHDVDILIVGGGMGACGAAYEAARWGKDNGVENIMLCDKACLERSGAVAQGLSAINTYIGKDRGNTPDDYVRMVRTDLMGLVREDLIFDVGRHVDDSVHLFEDWGLPCWIKQPDGKHNWNGAQAKQQGKSLRAG